jgi:hypothetical protein
MAAVTAPDVLSLADLEAYDPQAPAGNRERRFLCPLCGDGKPHDRAHRSLSASTEHGAWHCNRCDARGKLIDFWTAPPGEKPGGSFRTRKARRAPSPLVTDYAATDETAQEWQQLLKGLKPLAGTPGETYLSGRGIPMETARRNGARFSPNWYGRPAVVWPIRNHRSTLVAAQGRYTDARTDPKARTAGPKSNGVFMASWRSEDSARTFAPLEASAPAVIITEAPIDALSLCAAGYPAIALCGTSGPGWLHIACGLRRVLLAFDGDSAGDNAAAALIDRLEPYGARCERLRPDNGKDWNEVLQAIGADALADWLAWRVLKEPHEREAIEAL